MINAFVYSVIFSRLWKKTVKVLSKAHQTPNLSLFNIFYLTLINFEIPIWPTKKTYIVYVYKIKMVCYRINVYKVFLMQNNPMYIQQAAHYVYRI